MTPSTETPSKPAYAAATLAIVLALSCPSPAHAQDKFTLHGYSSFEIEKQLENDGEGHGDANGSFDADLFDLVINFTPVNRVRAAADISLEHGAATEDGRGNVALEYGFAEYSLSDAFRVRAGKMFTPFGYFNEIHTAKPAFLSVKEAPSTNKPERIVDMFRFFPRWGTGIALQGDIAIGDFNHLDYNLMLTNGEQENTNPFEEDDNSSKSLTARTRLDLNETWVLGLSAYYDYSGEAGISEIISGGTLLEFNLGNLRLLSETALGFYKLDGQPDPLQLGLYLQPSYRLIDPLVLYTRAEWVSPDLKTSGAEGWTAVLGLNYEPAENYMLKLEHNYFKGASESSLRDVPAADYNEVKAALAVGF